jgi:hypothetical protein
MAGSFNGRTAGFESAYVGSIPTPAAMKGYTDMKVYNQQEIKKLLQSIEDGDADIVYAREAREGLVYCTFRVSRPLIEGLPKMPREPTM